MNTSVLLCIPMHNYATGVVNILEWAKGSHVLNRTDWTTVIYDDHSRPEEVVRVQQTLDSLDAENRRFDIISVTDQTKLQHAIKESGVIGTTLEFDTVLVCESDAAPEDETLHSMLDLYCSPIGGWEQPGPEAYKRHFIHGQRHEDGDFPVPKHFGKIASISPCYTWKGDYCYPTQWKRPDWNWLSVNDSGDCYQIQNTEHGKVGLARAVPFLFSLWHPECLTMVNSDMPTLHHLDTALGARVWNEGYINLRLLDRTIDHVGGGGKSRR